MSLDPLELKRLPIVDLVAVARDLHIDNAGNLRRQDLIFEILRLQSDGNPMDGSGVLEILPDGFGFLRSPDFSFQPGPDDVYVSPSQIRRFNLRTGDTVDGQIRAPKEGEKYFALIRIERVNARSPEKERDKLLFSNMTAVHPTRRIPLGATTHTARFVDLVAPLAFGHRVLVHAPLRAGRTTLIAELTNALASKAHPFVVLVDERPEEVTDLGPRLQAPLLASTIDEGPARHIQVAEMALEHAKRIAEQGKDVVLILDSLSRLLRAYNATSTSTARPIDGVVDPQALHRTRRFIASGRDLREGGSLTIITTVQPATESPLDALLAEDLAAVTHADIHLSNDLAREGLFPAIDPGASRTHRPDLLLEGEELAQHRELRSRLSGQVAADHAWLDSALGSSKDNRALLARLADLDAPAAIGR